MWPDRWQIKLTQEYHTRLTVDLVTGKLDTREPFANMPREDNEDPVEEGGPPMDRDISEGFTKLEESLT